VVPLKTRLPWIKSISMKLWRIASNLADLRAIPPPIANKREGDLFMILFKKQELPKNLHTPNSNLCTMR